MRIRTTVFVALIIVIIALAQSEIFPVLASEKEETPLQPSGSAVDNRIFKSGDYIIANGFGVAITMDLPVKKMENTHGRVTFAVCLGNEAEYHSPYPPYNDWYYTPYVKEMRVKIEGDGDYEPQTGVIVDNTGTGGSSLPDFWTGIGILFTLFDAYQLALFLQELYAEPPNVEWKPGIHAVEPIVRQDGNPHKEPRLQTAGAWFDNYFKRDGWNTLTITAKAEIWLRTELHDIVGTTVFHQYIGTYQVSYQVSILVGQYTLYLAAGSGGTTSPAPAIYEYAEGTSVTVTALPYSGYTFKYWLLDGTAKSGNPITVTMNSDHGLKACFRCESYCPILFVWNGTDYDEEGLLDVHNPDGIDLVYNHTLITEPTWTMGRYQLRLVEHPKTHSYMDQVKLYAVLEDGTEIELPLTYAWHSEHGNVLPQLLFSDEWKTDTLGADLNNGKSQSIDLKFRALPPNLQAATFIFQIEGNNALPK